MPKKEHHGGIWMDEGHTLRPLTRLVVNVKDGTVLVRIPGGRYEIGDGKDKACPKHEVELSEFWLGVYCVSNRQYGRFVEETGHRAPDKGDYLTTRVVEVWKNGKCPEEKLDHPVVCVSWEDAVAYGKWAGLELPSEAQWEVGARGPGGLIYPWGNEWDEKKCRNSKNRGSEETCAVWGYEAGVSGWGTYQQSGNLHEWCWDWRDWDYYKQSGEAKNPRGPATGSYRMNRGGSWSFSGASVFRGADRFSYDPGYRRGDVGFRLGWTSP